MPEKNIKRRDRPLRRYSGPHGGVDLPHHKNTAEIDTENMLPERVVIPMQQHVGAPCKPLVKAGDSVQVGQMIGDTDHPIAAPIHASVSGRVKSIGEIVLPNGQKSKTVVIESDGMQMKHELIRPPDVGSKEAFLKAVRASGLVGLGGAGFPAHVKLNPPEGTQVDTLLINGAECEPYITADYREVMENGWDVMSGVYAVKELLGIRKVVIAIEKNKINAIRVLAAIAHNRESDPRDEVTVMVLPTRYPQGAEKVLVQQAARRVIPAGKLPADVGVVVMNITSISFLARFLKTGMPLVEKRLTIDGSAVQNPQNVMAPVGTPVKDVIAFTGGYKEPPHKLLMGGPMMGVALADDSLPILKQSNAILAFTEKEFRMTEPLPCIRCGRCVEACPMKLVPTEIERQLKIHSAEGVRALGVLSCMECGCCSFVCPARRYLVQSMRLGKQLAKKET